MEVFESLVPSELKARLRDSVKPLLHPAMG